MSKEYVLVSQGMVIYKTKDKLKAEKIMNKENDKFYKYKQQCLDNYEPYADTEIEMFEEEANE